MSASGQTSPNKKDNEDISQNVDAVADLLKTPGMTGDPLY